MWTYLVRRLLGSMLVLLGVTVIAFAAVAFIPADAVDALLGAHSTPEAEAAMRHRLGLDRPLWEQYLGWFGGLLRGDLGKSLNSEQPVTEMLRQRFPVTLELAFLACVISIVVGVPAGLVAATRQYSLGDKVSTGISMLGLSIPDFWLATLLILLFSVAWQLLPPGGRLSSLWEDPAENLRRLAMPALAIGLPSAAVYFRMTRSAMLEVIKSPYIVTAYSKGLRERQVIVVHALKNALIPVITMIGLQFGNMMGASVVIETLFARVGLGRLLVTGILQRDYPLIQGTILVFGVIYIVSNLVIDVLYALVDPRIHYA